MARRKIKKTKSVSKQNSNSAVRKPQSVSDNRISELAAVLSSPAPAVLTLSRNPNSVRSASKELSPKTGNTTIRRTVKSSAIRSDDKTRSGTSTTTAKKQQPRSPAELTPPQQSAARDAIIAIKDKKEHDTDHSQQVRDENKHRDGPTCKSRPDDNKPHLGGGKRRGTFIPWC